MLSSLLRRSSWTSALRYPAYRWFFVGRLASSATIQMRTVAQGWLVYSLTESSLALTWVGAARSAVMLVFSLYGGALSDRIPKRQVMLWCRAIMLLNYVALATLVLTGRVRVWQVAASSMLDGLVFAFNMPAQSSITAELVDREDLLNALAVASLGRGIISVLASAGAGLIIDSFGPAGVFYAMAALYGVVVNATTRLPDRQPMAAKTDVSPLNQIRQGLTYLAGQPVLISVLALRLARTLLYLPYRMLLPAFVEETLQLGATGLGLMLSMASVGALLSSLGMTILGDRLRQGRLLLCAGYGAAAGLILLVTVPFMPLPYVCMLVIGAMGNILMVTSNSVTQTQCQPQFRGRVSGVAMMLQGLQPLGSLPEGALADAYGASWVIGGQGVLLMLAFGLIARRSADLRCTR